MTGHKRKRILSRHGKYDHHATKQRNDNPIAKHLHRHKATTDKVHMDYDRKKEREEVENEVGRWEQSQE